MPTNPKGHFVKPKVRDSYFNEICEKIRWHPFGRLYERKPHKLSQFPRCLRQQNACRILQIRNLKQPVFHILLFQANTATAQHQLVHLLRVLYRHAVPHKPTVTYPHQAHPVHPVRLHHAYHALSLERLGPVPPARVGLAEEDQVRYVDVEPRGEVE